MTKIEWRKISGYGDYLVSNMGDVVSTVRYVYSKRDKCTVPFRRLKVLSQHKNRGGYMCVGIGVKATGGRKTMKVHRLVAMAFIPNPEGLPEINHKDGNKTNNRVDNLEWASHSDNVKHAYKIGLQPNSEIRNNSFLKNRKDNSLRVVVMSDDGKQKEFPSMQHCADFIGVDRSVVSRSCNAGKPVRGYTITRLNTDHQMMMDL